MTTRTTILLGVAGALFVLMGAVQFNDQDAPIWIALYSASAALSFGAAIAPIRARWPILIGFSAFAVGVGLLAIEGLPTPGDNEVVRELGGVVVVALHAAWVAKVARSPYGKWVDGRPLA